VQLDAAERFSENCWVVKQVVFIGSSSEGINLARTLRSRLQEDRRLKHFEFKLWTDVFAPMRSPASVLTDLLTTVSLAILVFTADDVTKKRGRTMKSVRDNLLFEFGLFWGKLGLTRTLVLVEDRAQSGLASDIGELTFVTFQRPAHGAGQKEPPFAELRESMDKPSMEVGDWVAQAARARPGAGDLPPTLLRLAANWRKRGDADFQLYSFSGLSAEIERAGNDGSHNQEAVHHLWADAEAGSWIKAAITEPDLFRVTFCNKGGSSSNIALRLNKCRVPEVSNGSFTKLRFEARVPHDWQALLAKETAEGNVERLALVSLGIRLIDSLHTHWKLCRNRNGEYAFYDVVPCEGDDTAWKSFEIKLTDKQLSWCVFGSDGNYRYADEHPDFKHILAVVLELGKGLVGASVPGPGMGVIEFKGLNAV